MSLFNPGPPVLAGVDEVLRVLTAEALKGLAKPVSVTVGPLDRPMAGARLNWFLYRISPAVAYANMEPPQHGWRTKRGHPPLALTLHYLLTADAGELGQSGAEDEGRGDEGREDEVVHAALSAAMSALHEYSILGIDTPVATVPDLTVSAVASSLDGMIEPLRISLEQLSLESLTSLWRTGSRSLRLSVGYQVSLVSVPAQTPSVAGPPALATRLVVAPTTLPVIESVKPDAAWLGASLEVHVRGLADSYAVTLGRLPGDPDDPTDGRPDPAATHSTGPWRLAANPAPHGLTLQLPNGSLVPGVRTLEVANLAENLPVGSARATVTVVPRIVSVDAPLQPGNQAILTVHHVAGPGLVFLGATSTQYETRTDTTIAITVPPLPPHTRGASTPASIRCATITGPPTDLAVAP